jgi:hypothetical protein
MGDWVVTVTVGVIVLRCLLVKSPSHPEGERGSNIRCHWKRIDNQGHRGGHAACCGSDGRGRDMDIFATERDGFIDVSLINQCSEDVIPVAYIPFCERTTYSRHH